MLKDRSFIDIHSHDGCPSAECRILSLDISEIGNDLAMHSGKTSENHYLSIGIHPWFIERQQVEKSLQALQTLGINPAVIAIGECGLDRCIDTTLATQIEVFSRQIELSERIKKPLIIHCVRAFSELLAARKVFHATQPWIIHGFTGKPALAQQLIKHGCYLSFGKALLNSNHRVDRSLQTVPLDHLFLETDAANVSIDAIYAAAAKMRGLDTATLRQHIMSNFKRVFLND
jgi:TatD DNase family protein